MNDLSLSLLQGRVGVDGAGGIRNPVLMGILVIAPLAVVTYHQLTRHWNFPHLSLPELTIGAIFLYSATVLNLGQQYRWDCVKDIFWKSTFLIVFFVVFQIPDSFFATLASWLIRIYGAIPVLSEIRAESWLLFFYIYISYEAIRNFGTRPALWIGRQLLWRPLFVLYIIFVVTLAVIHSVLPSRMRVAWHAAQNKQRLLKNPSVNFEGGIFKRWTKWTVWLADGIIGSNAHVASTVELMLFQRRFFEGQQRDHQLGHLMVTEDSVAVILLLIGFSVILVLQIFGLNTTTV